MKNYWGGIGGRPGVVQDEDLWYRVTEGKRRRIVPGDWNLYRTLTGALAGMRAYRKHGPPARSGPHETPEEIKALRRRP
jgi:hypothetical protein